MDERFKKEIKRKAFHFLSLLYAALYLFVGRTVALAVLVPLLAVEAFVDFGRFYIPGMNDRLLKLFGGIHRKEESGRVSGIFWTLAGCVLTMLLFERREIVLCALGYLAFGDGLAGLAGVRFGRHTLIPGKSLEGSLACFAACLAVGLIFLPPPVAAAAALFATAVEMIPLPYNDNLWLPVLSGIFLSLIA
jgi:dolichol kinase